MKKLLLLTFLSFLFIACNAQHSGVNNNDLQGEGSNGSIGNTNGSGVGGTSATLANALSEAVQVDPVVEITHLVEPQIDSLTSGGAYLTKLTIPKNYKGLLHLSGINLGTLNGRSVFVRFNLGVNKTPITVRADVGVIPGLISTSSVSALTMDLRNRPFADLRLLYDLYDYNDYSFDGVSSTETLDDAVSYNRDTKLFCRGLSLEDDPTFTGNVADGCTEGDDVCKYAYANIVDQGLIRETSLGDLSISPSRAQIQSGSAGYYNDSNTEKLSRCLPSNPYTGVGGAYNYVLDNSVTFSSFGNKRIIDSQTYRLDWPFRLISTNEWKISPFSNASINRFGLFNTNSVLDRVDSYLFPRYVKYSLASGIQYLGGVEPTDDKTLQTTTSNGESLWMDGCNERAVTTDPVSAEHVGSCDVTASIEVFYIDATTGAEVNITTSKDVKLQIVKNATLSDRDTNVIEQGFQACTSTNQCGTSECCIQNRCWDKSIVSSCYEDEVVQGNEVTGSNCSNDFECASLCCNGGTCQPHNTNGTEPVLCSKPVGQSCVARDWCAEQPVTRCLIVKTGVDPQGAQQCALRCYTFDETGNCRNGVCTAPTQPQQPVFDETDPNRCDDACDAPDLTLGFFNSDCGN